MDHSIQIQYVDSRKERWHYLQPKKHHQRTNGAGYRSSGKRDCAGSHEEEGITCPTCQSK